MRNYYSRQLLGSIIYAVLFFLQSSNFCYGQQNEEQEEPSCVSHSDCVVKNVGNCCGYYPGCVHRDYFPDAKAVQSECEKNGMMSICGFAEIDACGCSQSDDGKGRCEPLTENNIEDFVLSSRNMMSPEESVAVLCESTYYCTKDDDCGDEEVGCDVLEREACGTCERSLKEAAVTENSAKTASTSAASSMKKNHFIPATTILVVFFFAYHQQ